MEDQQIIELFFDRDEQAIRETNEKYGKLCHRTAYAILNNLQDAEECVNDTYTALWHAIPPARPTRFMAYICKITRNLALNRLEFLGREKRAADVMLSLEELSAVVADERYAPHQSDKEIGAAISRFLRGQKEEARNVFIRKYFFFDSVKDIACRYSLTESKVKILLFRTRNHLKDYLIKEGIAL